MRRLALLCVVLAALVSGGSGLAYAALRPAEAETPSAPESPGAFVKRLIVQVVRDDYARAWLTLHPAHKAVASRWTYVDCELLSPVPGDIVSLDIVRIADGRFAVPGVGRVRGKAVAFRLVLRQPATTDTVTVTHTSHVVAVGGHWRWILTPERYALYRDGGCGGNAPAV